MCGEERARRLERIGLLKIRYFCQGPPEEVGEVRRGTHLGREGEVERLVVEQSHPVPWWNLTESFCALLGCEDGCEVPVHFRLCAP